MEHIINALHGIMQRAAVADVADVELDLASHLRHPSLEVMTHVVLLLLVAAEDADLAYVGTQEPVQNRIAEAAGTARNQQRLVFENTHMVNSLLRLLLNPTNLVIFGEIINFAL